MRHRLDTRMVGDPREMYAQSDARFAMGGKPREAKWAMQVVLYAQAMLGATLPATDGVIEGRFDGRAVHFGRWIDSDGVSRFVEIVVYPLPQHQLPAPPPVKALPAPKVV